MQQHSLQKKKTILLKDLKNISEQIKTSKRDDILSPSSEAEDEEEKAPWNWPNLEQYSKKEENYVSTTDWVWFAKKDESLSDDDLEENENKLEPKSARAKSNKGRAIDLITSKT